MDGGKFNPGDLIRGSGVPTQLTLTPNNRTNVIQHARTSVAGPPPANALLEGEIAVVMVDPMQLYVGVPTSIDSTGQRLILDASITAKALPDAPTDGAIYGRGGSPTAAWVPVVPTTGATMTGPLYLPSAAPTVANQAAPKSYVDNALAAGPFVPIAGATMTGSLTLNTAANLTVNGKSTFAGIGFGSVLAASATDVSKHIALYATNYGLNITSAALNVVAAGSVAGTFNSTGLVLPSDPTATMQAVTKHYVDTNFAPIAGGGYVQKTGDTMSGALTISAATTAALNLTGTGAGSPTVTFNTTQTGVVAGTIAAKRNAVNRWALQIGDATAEAGSNAGSNLSLYAYSDTGTQIGASATMQIARATGAVTFAGALASGPATITGALLVSGTTTLQATLLANQAATFGSTVTLSADPVTALQASTKQYVDNSIAASAAKYLPLTGGTITGNLIVQGTTTLGVMSAGNTTISGTLQANGATTFGSTVTLFAAPTLAMQAANKGYVDTNFLALAGGTMTGGISFGSLVGVSRSDTTKHITLNTAGYGFGVITSNPRLNYNAPSGASHVKLIAGIDVVSIGAAGLSMVGNTDIYLTRDPTLALQATTKQYVDGLSPQGKYVLITGDTMEGALQMGGYQLGTLRVPVNPDDAATKHYVDQIGNAAYQGQWHVAANTPDLGTLTSTNLNTYEWFATTVNPNVPEIAPPDVPGIAGLTIHNGDRIIWSTVESQYDVYSGGLIDQSTADATYVFKAGDTMTGPLTMSTAGGIGMQAVYAANPMDLSKHLELYPPNYGLSVTSGQLNFISNAAFTWYSNSALIMTLNATNLLMAVPITLPFNPTAALQAVTKQYVDNGFLPITGGTITGNLAVSGTLTVAGATTLNGITTHGTGVNFGSRTGSSNTDLSQHIALYSNNYGIGITSSRLNILAGTGSVVLMSGSTDIASFNGSGINMITGAVNLLGNPTTALQAAPKQYVDSPGPNPNPYSRSGTTWVNAPSLTSVGNVNYDMNSLPAGYIGFHQITNQTTPANFPPGQNTGFVISGYNSNSGWTDQLFMGGRLLGDNSMPIWFRCFTNVTWSAWCQIITGAGGAFTGPITLAADPTTALGAATKQYVDNKFAAGVISFNGRAGPVTLLSTDISAASGLLVTGGTMTGALLLAANPTQPLGAATKQYVDAAVAADVISFNGRTGAVVLTSADVTGVNGLLTTGGTMTGTLAFSAPNPSINVASGNFIVQIPASGVVNLRSPLGGQIAQFYDSGVAAGNWPEFVNAAAGTQWQLSSPDAAGGWIRGTILFGGAITFAGAVTFNSTAVLSADPTTALGAATKQYVDAVRTLVTGSYVALAGSTMTGALILNANPTANLGAATKQYVDSPTANPLPYNRSGATWVPGLAYTRINTDQAFDLNTISGTGGGPYTGYIGFHSVINQSAGVNFPPNVVTLGVWTGYSSNAGWNYQLAMASGLWYRFMTSQGNYGAWSQVVLASGATMTGALVLAANPTTALGAATKQYVDTNFAPISVVGSYVSKAGDTMTGSLYIQASYATVALASPAGTANQLVGYRGSFVASALRWDLAIGDNTAETGSNAGTNFDLNRYDDSGNFLGTALGITRATGAVTFGAGMVTASSGRIFSQSNGNNPFVGVYDTGQNVAAGMLLGGSNMLYLANVDGNGNYLSTRMSIDSGGNATFGGNAVVTGQLSIGGQGLVYTGLSGSHRIGFLWDGSWVQAYIDGAYQYQLASIPWVENNYATTSWIQGNYYTAGTSDGRYLYKTGDTCTGNFYINGWNWVSGQLMVSNGLMYVANNANYYFGRSSNGDWTTVENGQWNWASHADGSATTRGTQVAAQFQCTGSLGVYYTQNGHWFAFGWDGQNVPVYVDGGYQGTLVTGAWVTNWVQGQGYGNASWNGQAQWGWYYSWGSTQIGFYWSGQYMYGYVNGTSAYPFANALCDARMKYDIAPSRLDCLAMINAMPLFEFRRKPLANKRGINWEPPDDDDTPLVRVGLIAQEAHEVFPECVMDGSETTLWGTDHNTLIAALIGSVQQLTEMNAALSARVESLERMVH